MSEAYKELTDSELNKRIAQALGYVIYWKYDRCKLFDHNGDDVTGVWHLTEAETWADVPNWVDNLYLAMGLLSGTTWRSWYVPKDINIVEVDMPDGSEHTVTASKFQRAICEAWLAWKEAQE